MAFFNFPPPPVSNNPNDPSFRDWFYKIARILQDAFNLENATGVLPVEHGGTGLSNYVVGDILYCSSTDALARRAVGTNGQVLTVSGGVPVWTNSATASLPQNKLTQNTIVPQDTSYIIAKQFDTNGFSMVINGHFMVIG